MAIVFMGTPQFAVPCLHALHQAGYRIAAVYTRPDKPAGRGRKPTPPPLKLAAQQLALPIRQPPSLRSQEAIDELAAFQPQVIIVCAYGHILRQPVLDIPPKGILNLHPSLLPRHRGASPIPATILAGDDHTGVTVMLMDPGMDSGPILAQRSLPVIPLDTAATLADKLSPLAADLLLATLPRWLAGDITPKPQDHSQATIAPLLKKADGAIDWNLPATDIGRRVRAYNPWPGAFTTLHGQLLHIWEAWPLPFTTEAEPGTVLSLSAQQLSALPPGLPRQAFAVQTGDGVLAVLKAQRAGRRPLPAPDFLRGLRDFIGSKLVTPPQQ